MNSYGDITSGYGFFDLPNPKIPTDPRGLVVLVEMAYVIVSSSTTGVEYFSNTGYLTSASDSIEPNRYYQNLLTGDPLISKGFNEPLTIGNLKFKNNGELDKYMTSRYADGQTITLSIGQRDFTRSQFVQVFTGLVKTLHFSGDELTVVISDNKELLNMDVQPILYAETTTNPNAGKPVPLLFGECFNVEPLKIDVYTYEYHWGSVPSGAINMRDTGAAFTYSITPNGYSGAFDVSQDPKGTFTGDLKGYVFGSTYDAKLTTVFKDIATYVYAGASFDSASFAYFEAVSTRNPTVGIYLTEKTNAVQLLDELMACVRGTWFFNEVGDIQIAQLDGYVLDGTATTNTVISSYHILSISLETSDQYPVCYEAKMGCKKNWTKQDPSTLVDISLTAADKIKFKSDYQIIKTYKLASVKTAYPHAISKTIDLSYLTTGSQVLIEVTNRVALQKKPRFLLKVKCTGYQQTTVTGLLKLGELITVNSSRYGSKKGLITKISHYLASGTYDIELLV